MNDKTQAATDAVSTAPISANVRRMPGLSEQDAGLLEQAASMLESLHNDERNRGNCFTAEGAACSADAVRRLAVQLLRAAPPARECLQQSDLHDAIMNLPCEASASQFLMKAERHAYRSGHKDARHAAAELAAALQAAPPAPAAVPEHSAALQKIIDLNIQYCVDRHGDAAKAEGMACVRVARAALAAAPQPPAAPATTGPQAATTGAGGVTAGAAQEPPLLTDELIQQIDYATHFHEAHDWPIRFARAIEAEVRKKVTP